MLKQKGKAARLTVFVDVYYAHDQVTQSFITGIIIMLNNAQSDGYARGKIL